MKGLLVLLAGVVLALGVGSPAATKGFGLPRADSCPHETADRPDSISGKQVHIIYALPSDLPDRCLDTDGTGAASVSNFQAWLRGQTGNRGLRIDTYGGGLYDISFHRFAFTDAELAAYGVYLRDRLEFLLRQAGFNATNKLYSVYYDGTAVHGVCGGGAWPPTLPGTVSALYLRSTFGSGNWVCYDPYLSKGGLQIMDFAMLHENLHTLGFVPTCAPHHTRAGHVSDNPTDIMWAGDGNWDPEVLDYGRDDYFNAPVPGCIDLADSSFLEKPGTSMAWWPAQGSAQITADRVTSSR